MKGLFSVAAMAVVLHCAGLAHAVEESSEPTPAQVRSAAEAFDRGREAYKSEDYVDAAEQFESADANAPSTAALELAIRARDKAGQLDRAATLAALALARHPDDPSIQKLAPQIIQRAKAELFELDLTCSDPCDVTVGGKIAPGHRATERIIFVSPGKYTVRAGWSGDRSASKSVEALKASSGSLEFQAPPEPTPPSLVTRSVAPRAHDRAADEATHQAAALAPSVFWIGLGLTAAVGGVSIWSGIDTQNNPGPDKVRDACQAASEDCQALYQKGLSNQHRTNILLGVTAGLGVVTAVIGAFFTDWGGKKAVPGAEQSRSSPLGLKVEPWFSVGSGASVGALGRF